MPIYYPANGVCVEASSMGGRSTQMVFRAASDRQVAMGDPNRACRPHSFIDAYVYRDRAHIPTVEAIDQQSPGDGDREYLGRTD